jgi:SAM-dependent methyltransferase
MRKIVLGGHWKSEEPGWEIYTQAGQDITKPLAFEDASVDVIFTEHVIEHVPFADGVAFFKDARRVLVPGGHIRTVCPMSDCMGGANAEYAERSLKPWFGAEEKVLQSLGLSLAIDPDAFLKMSLYTMHEHKFIWSRKLMQQVLMAIGFDLAYSVHIGAGEDALERRVRGNAPSFETYDPESGVVVGIK